MRLVNMDVDRYGTNERCHLGPLSSGLNAICGPRGSGKTTLLHWLRQVTAECGLSANSLSANSTAPWDNLSGSWNQWTSRAANGSIPFSLASGSVEISNRQLDFRVTTDRRGRIQFHPLQEYGPSASTPHISQVLSSVQREAFEGLASASGAADTREVLEQLASRLALSQLDLSAERRAGLEARERELSAYLERQRSTESRQSLLARQKQLEAELAEAKRRPHSVEYVGYEVEHRRYQERRAVIEANLRSVLERIEQLDSALASKSSQLELLDESHGAPQISLSYRQQLQQLDDRLNRWRQTLRDLKSHREAIEHNATDARLDRQIGDQLSSTKESDPRAAMRSLEAQILNTRQQLDALVDRYTAVPGYDYRSATSAMSQHGRRPIDDPRYPHPTEPSERVFHDPSGRTYIGREAWLPESSLLPETLRAMQKDLHEVCQQLARYEAKTATETFKQQSMQLKRCEEELLQSVEKLIEERAVLLRTIANEHHVSVEQLTLAFGNWCQCHDHPHLREWLLNTEASAASCPAADGAGRQQLIEDIQHLKEERKQSVLRADDCRRQLRDADLHRGNGSVARYPSIRGRVPAEIQRDLDQTRVDLTHLADWDRVRAELDEVRHELKSLTSDGGARNWYHRAVDHHIGALVPVRYRQRGVTADYGQSHAPRRQYDLVDGLITEAPAEMPAGQVRYEVPEAVVHIAMRLAIVEGLRQRGEAVSLILDAAADNLPPEIQDSVIAHLASQAAQGQQIVLLTGDERVADLVRSRNGTTHYLHARGKKQDTDVNRQLAALANDLEADKWYQPNMQNSSMQDSRGQDGTKSPSSLYYLQERSLIEELPSIEPSAAARCRALGVDRIGDLLDVDPHWLAENLRLDRVSPSTVITWQAKARLLCGVKNLLPFDARVLVGVGIRTPEQLADMHPSELLERVECFLSTDAGRRILRSGNSYELSRITSWIASAEGGGGRHTRSTFAGHGSVSDHSRSDRTARESVGYDNGRNSYSRNSRRSTNRRYSEGARDSGGDRSRSSRSSRRRKSSRRARGYPVIDRDGSRSRDWERQEGGSRTQQVDSRQDAKTHGSLRFYLELSSPVVDAPSIGPRGAARLEKQGIITVRDLLAANAESLASKLNNRKVTADTIREWQEQARLVCRIPNLRGHDAQLLVACDFISPEELATMDPDTVLDAVLEIAQSTQGQRILRGGKEPDLAEVKDWINWAASCRSLNAA